MKRNIIIISIMIAVLAFSQAIYKGGEVRLSPRLLNYQGYLTDTLGNPVNDSVDVIFRICDAASSGNVLWSELQMETPVLKGVFNVLLGSVTSIPDTVFTGSANRWLEIRISSQNLSPRTRIVTAPYALTAAYADTADCAQFLQGKDTIALDVRFVNEGQANSIFTAMIVDTAVTMEKIARAGASTDQVIKWNGTAWVPAADQVGAGASWFFLISDVADTTLQMGGRWGLARAGNILYGTADSTHVNLGVACTTGTSGQNNKYATVGGGYNNVASGYRSTVAGGYRNLADTSNATVSGGCFNTASNENATVGGGWANTASGERATVAGGFGNTASWTNATVGGGHYNTASNASGTVAGGYADTASGYAATVAGGNLNKAYGGYSAVLGGNYNLAFGMRSFVGGGYCSKARGQNSVVCGGGSNNEADSNSARGDYSFIGGGYRNLAGDATADTAATIAGGYNNNAIAKYTFSGGGRVNIAGGDYASVGGGSSDTVKAVYGGILSGYSNLAGDAPEDSGATVCGGWNNSANAKHSFVGGGTGNIAWNLFATVAGGGGNNSSGFAATAAGGSGNVASGSWSTSSGGSGNEASGYGASVIGGGDNISSGIYSMAGGYCDSSSASYCFTAGNNSTVLSGHDNSAVFNGLSSTASGQTRVGALSKVSGTFTIDHPLDPEHKILNHYFVESPEMSNLYEGEAVLDAAGKAEVNLPDYFNVLNRAPRIHLTGIGSSDVYVLEKVKENRFVIGGKPGTEVYWMVTGSRKDPSAEITKILMPVEQVKEGGLVGRSLDDEFLVVTMEQLELMGQSAGFKFRHASEQKRYEEMKRMIQESGARK